MRSHKGETEKPAMKRFTGLAVSSIFLLACGAAFGQTNLGFLSNDMSTLYCDYESLEYSGFLASGIHVNTYCNAPDGAMVGFKITLPPSNLPLTGTLYAMGDSEIDAYCDCWTGDQAIWMTQTRPYNIHAPQFGWEVLFNTYDAFYAYVDNWGYLIDEGPTVAAQAKSKSSKPQASFQPLSYSHGEM